MFLIDSAMQEIAGWVRGSFSSLLKLSPTIDRVAFNGGNRLQVLMIVRLADGWQGVGYGAD